MHDTCNKNCSFRRENKRNYIVSIYVHKHIRIYMHDTQHIIYVACHACATGIGINRVFGSMVAVVFLDEKNKKNHIINIYIFTDIFVYTCMTRATRIVLLNEKIKGIILLAYMFTNIFVYTCMTRATRIVFLGRENKRIYICYYVSCTCNWNWYYRVFESMVAVVFQSVFYSKMHQNNTFLF